MKLLKVLITDGSYLKSLMFIRAVSGFKDVELHVSSERCFVAGFFSRYCKHKTITASAKKYPELFIKQLAEYVKKNGIDVVIPILEDDITQILKNRKSFPDNVIIPFVDYKKYAQMHDKWNFYRLAERLKLLIPKTVRIRNLSDLDKIDLRFPLIVKIRDGAGSKGMMKVADKSELDVAFKSITKEHGLDKDTYPLVQEYIDGDDYCCASAICKHGKIKSVFVYKILRQYPIDHGTATSRVSIKDGEIEKCVRKMLTSLKWHGIAQFDFVRKDGKTYFLEMNPRLYASINATVKAGLNYPYYLSRIEDNAPIPEGYASGVKTRILMVDTLVFFKSLRRKKKYPLKEYLDCKKNVFFDDFSLSDPLPSIPLFIKFLRGKLV